MSILRLLTRRFLLPRVPSGTRATIRTMFTDETLDLLTYKNKRGNAMANVEGSEHFKWELKCYLDNEPKKDLLHILKATEVLLHLMSPSADDVDLLKKTLYQLNSFDEYTDKAKYTTGNLVMKALHLMDLMPAMQEFHNDPLLKTYFNGFKCTLLYMNLCYENKNYEEILEMDRKYRDTAWADRTSFSKFIDVLVFGACYKLNTAESFIHANNLWSKVGELKQFKKAAIFMAALAFHQQQWPVVINLSQILSENSLMAQFRLLTLCEMCAYNEVIDDLSLWLTDKSLAKLKLSKEVLEKLEGKLPSIPSQISRDKLQSVLKDLQTNERVTDETIENLLDRRISARIGIRGKRCAVENSQNSHENLMKKD